MEELPLKRPKLQQMLQSVVQNFGWTYSLFWKLCPQQGFLLILILFHSEDHYDIRTEANKCVNA
ncbi:Transcription factor TT8 [Dendrobium catenatum]|uniref:Transcription factor TT8 n=1 Tax=Dendrobium catenatum TaxID=906689 RepID=A0A2I0VRP6_9ASPA|nr:Transcription factor TT8 [Dendrobium catenatum]